jgi:hypothetical protein
MIVNTVNQVYDRDYKSRGGIVGKCQADEKDKLKLANSGKFELYPDVKPRNYYFLFFDYNSSIQSWCYQPS